MNVSIYVVVEFYQAHIVLCNHMAVTDVDIKRYTEGRRGPSSSERWCSGGARNHVGNRTNDSEPVSSLRLCRSTSTEIITTVNSDDNNNE